MNVTLYRTNIVCIGRDAKSYAKYNAIDPEVDQRACQDLICGSSAIAEGKRVLFQELVSKQQERVLADEVCVNFSLLLHVLACFCTSFPLDFAIF